MAEYMTKSEVVIQKLEEMISHGRLKPGDRMTATEVAEQFHVSRTPVNEALKRLSDRGLVNILPNVGFEVTVLPWNEIEDSMRLKMILEKTVIRWIRDRNMKVEIEPVMKIANRVIDAITQNDYSGYAELMREFHLAFISLAESKPLLTTYSLAWDYRSLEEPSFPGLAINLLDLVFHHIKILHCIEKKDFDSALEICQVHEDSWVSLYKKYLLKMGYLDAPSETVN